MEANVGGSTPAPTTDTGTQDIVSSGGLASADNSAAPIEAGSTTPGDYDWGAWTPDKEDYPETYKPAIAAARTHYEQQLAAARAAEQQAAFFRELWEGSEQGTSADEIARLIEARDELTDLKAQYDELNNNSSSWTTEKAQLAEEMTALQARLQEMETKWPEAEQELRTALNAEYEALLVADVDAFFAKHEDDFKDPKIVDAFAEFHRLDVPDAQAIELAKMDAVDQQFARSLLESGTPTNKVYGLALQASRSRTPPMNPAVSLTAGGGPVSRSSSPPARQETNPAPRPGASTTTGRLARTSAFLSSLTDEAR